MSRITKHLRGLSGACGCLAVLGGGVLAGPFAWAQPVPFAGVPFRAGEVLEFRVTSSRFGDVGSGRMAVEGPEGFRGREVLLLSMELEGRVALFGFEDRTRSWWNPSTGASLRFEKEERHPLARRTEAVDILLAEGRWEDEDGRGGSLATDAPLDELSFIYVLRTLDLTPGTSVAIGRHFDDERNPVQVRVVRRETILVPAGTFHSLLVEMEVRDPERYGDDGNVLRIHLTDDEQRLPLRIESRASMVGTVVLTLETWRTGS